MTGEDYTARFEAPDGKPILKAYPDPLTGAKPWTIGLGHTGPDVGPETEWSADRCMHAFYNDYQIATLAAVSIIGEETWANLNEARRAVLTDLAFNIGAAKLGGFHETLSAIRQQKWHDAAAHLLDSAYARQVRHRAMTNARTLVNGDFDGNITSNQGGIA